MKAYRLLVVFLVVLLAIVLIFSLKSSIFYQGCDYYSGIIGAILGSIITALLVFVAWEELGSLGRTSSADFIHKLKSDFFRPETRVLVSLLECNALKYCPNNEGGEANSAKGMPYFEVDESELNKAKLPQDIGQSLSKNKYYSAWDLDDMLLGHFEDIGMLEQRAIIDFQMVYDEFSGYIETAWDDAHIKKYIMDQRMQEGANRPDIAIYYHFQCIAAKCQEYDGLHSGLCIWRWKIKRRFRGPKIKMQEV